MIEFVHNVHNGSMWMLYFVIIHIHVLHELAGDTYCFCRVSMLKHEYEETIQLTNECITQVLLFQHILRSEW